LIGRELKHVALTPESGAVGLKAGALFSLTDHDRDDFN
jgi:hypothetical protein